MNAAIVLLVIGALVWVGVVILSGMGWNPTGVPWNFTNTGALGDSFGVVSSCMAGIAAYYAYRTYRTSRSEASRLERQAAEPPFLNLLERRFDILDRVSHGGLHGQEALDNLMRLLRANDLRTVIIRAIDQQLPQSEMWKPRFEEAVRDATGLSNLFRFTYHIVAFADRQFSDTLGQPLSNRHDPAYAYVRLMRAQLSDAELLLIALNCLHGEGRPKFKPLVERYALLHNLPAEVVEYFHLRGGFAPPAFGLPEPA